MRNATIFGIPLVVDPTMPEDEIWLVKEGKKQHIQAHEGPRAGETTETWLERPQLSRVINLKGSADD